MPPDKLNIPSHVYMLSLNWYASFSPLLANETGGGDGFTTMLFYGSLLMIAFWFIVLRPKSREENARKEKLSAVSTGDEVQTVGGILGKVTAVDAENDILTLEVDRGSHLRIGRAFVYDVRKKNKKGVSKD